MIPSFLLESQWFRSKNGENGADSFIQTCFGRNSQLKFNAFFAVTIASLCIFADAVAVL